MEREGKPEQPGDAKHTYRAAGGDTKGPEPRERAHGEHRRNASRARGAQRTEHGQQGGTHAKRGEGPPSDSKTTKRSPQVTGL